MSVQSSICKECGTDIWHSYDDLCSGCQVVQLKARLSAMEEHLGKFAGAIDAHAPYNWFEKAKQILRGEG